MIELMSTQIVVVNVTYFRPDYRSILQEFIWSTDDVVPELKRVHRFLTFWKNNIDAVIHNVEIAIPDQHTWRNANWYFGGNYD